jgi:hypothetical protein
MAIAIPLTAGPAPDQFIKIKGDLQWNEVEDKHSQKSNAIDRGKSLTWVLTLFELVAAIQDIFSLTGSVRE